MVSSYLFLSILLNIITIDCRHIPTTVMSHAAQSNEADTQDVSKCETCTASLANAQDNPSTEDIPY
jgi:hypothetical protein